MSDDAEHVERAKWPAGDEAPNKASMAVGLWSGGFSWDEIAEELNYSSPGKAREAVEHAVASTASDETKASMRRKMNARYNAMIRALWPTALSRKADEQIAAVRAIADMQGRQAKLYGLDAPAEAVIYTPTAEEIERYVQELTAPLRADLPSEADDIIVGEVVEP